MKIFTYLLIVLLLPLAALSQTSNPVFNWKQQVISPDKNLQGMTVGDNGSAVLLGVGRTFKKTTNMGTTWQDLNVVDATFDFKDISFVGDVGYVISSRATMIDNPSGGETDVKANGIIIKSIDKGGTWNILSLKSFGEGENTSLNPSAPGCYDLDFTAVQCVDALIAYVALRWNDRSTGQVIDHSAVFKTIDGGITWKAVSIDYEGDVINDIKRMGDYIYFGGSGMLQKIAIATNELTDLYPAIVAVNTDNSLFVYDIFIYNSIEIYATTSADGVFMSNDNGTTFTKLSTLTGGNAFIKLDSNKMICLGTSTRSKSTNDGGTSWITNYPGASCWNIAGVVNDSLVCLAKMDIYRIAVSDLANGVVKWKSQRLSPTESFYGMQIFDDTNALLIGGGEIVKKTSNKGVGWSDVTLPNLLTVDGLYDFVSLSQGEGAEYAVSRRLRFADYTASTKQDDYYSGLIVSSTDHWGTWKILNNKNVGKDTPIDPSKCPTMTGCFAMDPFVIENVDALNAYMYVDWYDTTATTKVTHSRVFKTSNGGDLWTSVTQDFGTTFIYDISFKGDTGYISGNKILLKTTDGGASFTDIYPIVTVGTDSSLIINKTKILSGKEIYVITSTDGIFYSNNVGESFSKVGTISGANDLVLLDKNSFMAVGSSTKTKFTNDGGASWKDCSPGSTIWTAGEMLNDSLYVLCKSSVFKIAVSDLDIKTSVNNLALGNDIKVYYGTSELKLVSSDKIINRCFVYSLDGKLIAITEPRAKVCKFNYSSFTPGMYIIAADVEGQRSTQKVVFK